MRVYDIPDYIVVNISITVNETVANAYDLPPRLLCVFRPERLR